MSFILQLILKLDLLDNKELSVVRLTSKYHLDNVRYTKPCAIQCCGEYAQLSGTATINPLPREKAFKLNHPTKPNARMVFPYAERIVYRAGRGEHPTFEAPMLKRLELTGYHSINALVKMFPQHRNMILDELKIYIKDSMIFGDPSGVLERLGGLFPRLRGTIFMENAPETLHVHCTRNLSIVHRGKNLVVYIRSTHRYRRALIPWVITDCKRLAIPIHIYQRTYRHLQPEKLKCLSLVEQGVPGKLFAIKESNLECLNLLGVAVGELDLSHLQKLRLLLIGIRDTKIQIHHPHLKVLILYKASYGSTPVTATGDIDILYCCISQDILPGEPDLTINGHVRLLYATSLNNVSLGEYGSVDEVVTLELSAEHPLAGLSRWCSRREYSTVFASMVRKDMFYVE